MQYFNKGERTMSGKLDNKALKVAVKLLNPFLEKEEQIKVVAVKTTEIAVNFCAAIEKMGTEDVEKAQNLPEEVINMYNTIGELSDVEEEVVEEDAPKKEKDTKKEKAPKKGKVKKVEMKNVGIKNNCCHSGNFGEIIRNLGEQTFIKILNINDKHKIKRKRKLKNE